MPDVILSTLSLLGVSSLTPCATFSFLLLFFFRSQIPLFSTRTPHTPTHSAGVVQIDGALLSSFLDLPSGLQLQLLRHLAQGGERGGDKARADQSAEGPMCPEQATREACWSRACAALHETKAGGGVPLAQLLLSPSGVEAHACMAGIVLPMVQEFVGADDVLGSV